MRWTGWLVRILVWGAVGALVLAFAAAFVLTRTGPGIDFVVREGLERLEASVDGSVSVEGVESPDLLEGAQLRGVEVRDVDGRLFARIDTLRFTYSVPALLRGDVVLYDVQARGFRLRFERLHGQEEMNVTRIFGGGGGPPTPADRTPPGDASSGPRITLRDVELSRGDVEVLLPLEPGEETEGAFVVDDPGGEGRLRSYSVRKLEAELPRASLSAPGRPTRDFSVARLAGVLEIQRAPVPLHDLRANVRLAGSSLTLSGARAALSGSRARGEVRVDWEGEGVETAGDLVLDPLRSGDLAWLVPDLPDARVRGPVGFVVGPDSTVFAARGARATTERSAVRAEGTIRTAPALRLDDLVVDLEPLAVDDVRPWVDRELPVRGRLEGTVQMDGTSAGMAVGGLVTLLDDGADPSTARLSGLVSLAGGAPAVEGFQLDVRPLDFALLAPLWPERPLPGRGAVRVEADGSLSEGVRFLLDAEHEGPGFGPSRVEASGTVRTDSTDLHLDLEGEVDPLDLRVVGRFAPATALEGSVEGTVSLRGPLGDLRIGTDLEVPAGRIAADLRLDARDPAAGYELDAEVTAARLSELFPALPDPTRVSGSFSVRGSGLDRETARGTARLRLVDSRAGRFTADTASMALAVDGGRIRVDTLSARTNLAEFAGSGEIGLQEGVPGGRVRISFRNDSLATARSLLRGDDVIVSDTLSALEREVLQLSGVDPDTLPTEASVRLDGRLEGTVTLDGTVDDFSVLGEANAEDVVYGPDSVRSARLSFSGTGLPGLEGDLSGVVAVDSVRWSGRSFAGGRAEVEYERPGGRATVEIVRSDTEAYRARGRFEATEGGAVVHLDEMALRFEPARWDLDEPATVQWGAEGLRVRNLRVTRSGEDPMRIVADGVLPARGEADFDVRIERLRLERLVDLLQSDERIEGALDLDLRVRGTARRPVATAAARVDSLRFRNVVLSRVEGTVDYEDRRARGELRAFREGTLAARVAGTIPVDLALDDREDRVPGAEMDLRVVVDAFPAVLLATVTEAVADVEGTVSGEVSVGGTIQEPATSGRFRVDGLAFRVPALGIRPTDVSGTLDLVEGERVRVDLSGRSGGGIRIRGTLGTRPLTDPAFDLTIEADGFQAVERRDLRGRLGARVELTGTYRRPVVTGTARVQESVLRIEELERSAEVVDLSDPRFFDVVDTTFASGASDFRESANPFVRNLQLDVDLQVLRDSWLRGRDINVEMRGDLVISWNRTTGDMVLTGQLNAVRGTYSAFQRQFQVTEGTIEFVGTPGLNPNLSISAVRRLRTSEGEPLTITAGVSGTLLEPRVSLSSDAQPPIAESDLVSYLIFGRPSYALVSGESQVLQGAAGRLAGVAGSFVQGEVAQQLGSAAQQVGVDYFAVTQAPVTVSEEMESFEGAMAATQVEAGWYLRQNVFVSFLFRPLAGLGSASLDPFPGVRAEWQLGDLWTVEGFVEDRLSRERALGFGDLGYQSARILGFFLYRDWGY